MKRTIGKLVRLTAKEQQRLRNHAKKCGLSEEAYLRFLLNGHSPKEVPPLEYHRLIRELNAIGNNLHCHIFNQVGGFYYSGIAESIFAGH